MEEVVEGVAEEEVEEGVEGAALDEARVHSHVVGRQQGRHQLGDACKTQRYLSNEDQSHYKKQLKSVLGLVAICCPSKRASLQ